MTPNWSSGTVRWIGSRLLLVLAVLFFTASAALAGHAVPAWPAVPAGAVTSASLPPRSAQPPHKYKLNVPLSKGKFLVASRGMQDPRFSETVIILLRYGWQGAVGLIINRPTKVGITKALPGVPEQHAEPVYFGGPVGMHEMRMLFKSASQPGDASHVFEDVYLSTSTDLGRRLVDGEVAVEGYRVYAGYAGWAARQLDKEVLRGGWHVMDGDADAIFNKKSSGIWSEFISSP